MTTPAARRALRRCCTPVCRSIEPLEQRRLLAADPTASVASLDFSDDGAAVTSLRPGDDFTATLSVSNVGDEPTAGPVLASIYAFAGDAAFDVNDATLLGSAATTAALDAGAAETVEVAGSLPLRIDAITAGLTRFFAVLPDGEAIEAGTFDYAATFGAQAERAGTALEIEDADGTRVTLDLTGGGSATLDAGGITTTGTLDASALSITTDAGGDGRYVLPGLAADGPLASLDAADADVTGPTTISLAAATTPTDVTLGGVTGLTLTSAAPIGTLAVAAWTRFGGPAWASFEDAVIAPSFDAIASAGDFAADVSADSLGTADVAGTLEAAWRVRGDVDRITAGETGEFTGYSATGRTDLFEATGTLRGVLASASFGTVRGDSADAVAVLAGTDLGADARLGRGSGAFFDADQRAANRDVYRPGTIDLFEVAGEARHSLVAAGLWNNAGKLLDGDDRVLSPDQSRVGDVRVGSFAASLVVAGGVDGDVTVDGRDVDPDDRGEFRLGGEALAPLPDDARPGRAEPGTVTDLSPNDGEELVGLTREAVVEFDRPVLPQSVNERTVRAIANGRPVPATVRVNDAGTRALIFYDEPLPASTEVRLRVDPSLVLYADGRPFAVAPGGEPAEPTTADFTTVPLTRIPGTVVFGYVKDSYNRDADGNDVPVEGATIRIDALGVEAVTDADGYFELIDVPAPEFFVTIDGSTAADPPTGSQYATLGKPFHSVPGERVQLEMDGEAFDIYLPPMFEDGVVDLDPAADTAVGFGETALGVILADRPDLDEAALRRLSVTYPAGSARAPDGEVAGRATVIPVDPDRLPAPLPPTAAPSLVISVQAATSDGFNRADSPGSVGGGLNFDEPAPVTFPNLEGLEPGTQSLLWSFDHDAGEWIVNGTMTVSADGLTITTDEGVGIDAPGWHFTQVGTVTAGEPCEEGEVCVQVNGGMLGDVIEVDLSGTGGRDFRLESNSVAGQVARFDGWEATLRDEGRFYFVPSFDAEGESRFAQRPATAEYTFSGIGRLESDPPDEPERRLFFVAQVKDVRPGYSGSGAAIVPTGTLSGSDALAVYRVQQRLRWLGYKVAAGDGAASMAVDGDLGGGTRHGLGVLNAAVSGVLNEDHAPSADVPAWINAANAPRWVEYQIPAGVVDNENSHEHWMTSWARDSLDAFHAAAAADFTAYNGASLRGGGDTPHHGTHEAGMDVDIDISAAEQSDAQQRVGTTGSLGDAEQAIVGRMLAVYNNATVPVGRVLVGFERVADAVNAAIGTPENPAAIAVYDSGNVHDNHIHVDYQPPTLIPGGGDIQRTAGDDGPVSTAAGFGNDPSLHYHVALDNGLTLSGTTDRSGTLDEVLAPEVGYVATFYQPSTNSWAAYEGTSAASGQVTRIGTIILDNHGGPDADGDGIPDAGELALGTDPESADSDGDGLSDAAELTQGLDPRGEAVFPTGVIAGLPLRGGANAVIADGTDAFVATSAGLAVVDAADFRQPIVQGQLDLPGAAVALAYDPASEVVAVAAGEGGLHLVDVSDRMLPELIRTVAVDAAAVAVVDGVAYVAVDNTLQVIDIEGGENLQTLTVAPNGGVTRLARDGATVYAVVGSELVAIDAAFTGEAEVDGRVGFSAIGEPGLSVGGGVAYVTGGGLITIDVSDPAAMTVISGRDETTVATAAAPNGSGLALVAAGDSGVRLYDVRDPAETANFLTGFPTTTAARDVAVSRGIGFVAAGDAGLLAVNYLPFDAQGVAPTVALSLDAADADPDAPGLQVIEGTTLALRADADDDVQVRSVDLFVDGEVARGDVSFPFGFDVPAPAAGEGGPRSVTVRARATDTGGNAAFSEDLVIEVLPDTFAPALVSDNLPDGGDKPEGFATVRLRFDEPVEVAEGAATLVEAGGDGEFGTDDDRLVRPETSRLREGGRLLRLGLDPLPVGEYRLTLDAGGVSDRAGNALAEDLTRRFGVVPFDVAPDFLPFGSSQLTFSDDQSIDTGPLPFDFDFFGGSTAGQSLFITSNGVAQFGAGVGGSFSNTALPAGESVRAIFGFWDDLDPRSAGRIGFYDGPEGGGVRAVTWEGVGYYPNGTDPTVTFQIALYAEGTIVVRYGEMGGPPLGNATIGLSNNGVAVVPSAGTIENAPELALVDDGGLISDLGLPGLDGDATGILAYVPDGEGGYAMTFTVVE